MANQKRKKQSEETLSQIDLLRMLLCRAKIGEAKALHKFEGLSTKHHAALGELNAARLQAQTERNLSTSLAQEKAAKALLDAATQESTILAAEIAARYAVDWKQASYDPLTGAIVRHPGES